MKALTSLVALLVLALVSYGQINIDSVQQKLSTPPQLPDSLKTTWLKVDSIRVGFNHSSDSLRGEYQQLIAPIDSKINKVQHKIDSLNKLGMPANALTQKLDSLDQKRKALKNDLDQKTSSLKTKTIGKLDKVEMTPGMEKVRGDLTQQVNGFNLSDKNITGIPSIEVPGYSIPDSDQLSSISSQLGEAGKVAELPKVDTPLGNVTDITGEVKGLSEDITTITKGGNLNDLKNIDKTIESQAGKIEGVQELQKQSGAVDGLQGNIDKMGNPDALKQEAKAMAKKEAINHFAGKEEQLKAAMDKLSKYKAKYSSVKSIKDLPKRPPNAMKGKPFIERFVPGMYLQFQNKNGWFFDVNPYGSYKISGRFTSGLGWNQRFVYDHKAQLWLSRSRIFGPRAFVDFHVGKGFNVHLEQEVMNTFVPNTLTGNTDNGKREWVWSTMLGLKKQYKIYKNLNGTVLIQYNLFNLYYKAPYLDRLNSRIGFEYTLKKKQSKEEAKN
ncbi:hypothetical protein [Chryseosolibacter indicus]|uniref:Uncharacterized protein n=1 Tax=Chryseosolibacter indicus TaxID=2782351 RepID=A0ABS5VKG2_9BACT|nr:hypothetical protein [Chryseosolibacter indicus]MBT1701935.1 hypothetical protein [Chryseosolibacter indicus]